MDHIISGLKSWAKNTKTGAVRPCIEDDETGELYDLQGRPLGEEFERYITKGEKSFLIASIAIIVLLGIAAIIHRFL